MSVRWFRPKFHVANFLRSLVQKSHINPRSELSGDHFHEWAKISSKFSRREFLKIHSTKEPHQSQKSAIQGYFHEWAMISSKLSCREFLVIYSTRKPHPSKKWAIQRKFPWVGVDFVQTFMSRFSWDLEYKRATSITEVSYLETIFFSGRWFRSNFHVESFSRSKIQESHIIHTIELSGDHFHECAMIPSKISCREFLKIYSTKEPHQSQKWAIWRSFSWVGEDFVQIFMSRVSQDP